LHDDLHHLVAGSALVGARNRGREVWGEFAYKPTIALQDLGEGGLGHQEHQEHAQAFSPGSAVALTSTWALCFQSLRHKSHLSEAQRTNVARKPFHDSAYLLHGRGQSKSRKLL
jgi:hypothetical protein